MSEADLPTLELGDETELHGRFVTLRPVTARDYDFLFLLWTHPRFHFTGRLSGHSLAPSDMDRLLWKGVLTQYMVLEAESHQAVGIVTAYNENYRDSYAYIAAAFVPEVAGRGWPFEGLLLLIRLLFRHFPFRKLYMEALAFNFEQFRSGASRFFQVEGRLKEHFFLDGKYWDLYHLAIYRDAFEEDLKRWRQIADSAQAK